MSESLIELYVAFPNELDAPTRMKVEAHLRVDAVGQEIAEYYRTFYRALRGIDASGEEAQNGEVTPRLMH